MSGKYYPKGLKKEIINKIKFPDFRKIMENRLNCQKVRLKMIL